MRARVSHPDTPPTEQAGGDCADSSAERAAGHSAPCCDQALARAFTVLGKRWNGVLIGTLIEGPAGFAQIARSIDGISESVLSDRLTELAKTGLLSRHVHDGPPVTVTYELTPRGQALVPALSELGRWAADSLPASE